MYVKMMNNAYSNLSLNSSAPAHQVYKATRNRCVNALALIALLVPSPVIADQLIDNVQGIYVAESGTLERFNGLILDDWGIIKKRLQKKDKRPKKVTFYYDGQEQYLLPAFGDAHISLYDLTVVQLGLDLLPHKDVSGVLNALSRYAAENDSKRWLLGNGWGGNLDNLPLNAVLLDAVVAERPVVLFNAEGTAAILNSRAITLLEMNGAALPADGRVMGSQLAAVRSGMPNITAAELDMAFVEAQDWLLARGITHVSDFGTSLKIWQAYRRAGDEGRLSIRISSYAGSTEDMAMIAGPRPTPWLYDDKLRLSGLFLGLSGTLNENAPEAQRFDAQLRNRSITGASDHFALAFNVTSAEALSEMLSAVADISDVYKDQSRWRFEISGNVRSDQLKQLSGRQVTLMPVVAQHEDANAPMLSNIDIARGLSAYGTIISWGSFSPHSDINGFKLINLLTSIAMGSNASGALSLAPVQQPANAANNAAMGVYWNILSRNAAKAGDMDKFVGSLDEGKRADFILVSEDPMLTGYSTKSLNINATWVSGRPVWQGPNAIRPQ